MHTSFNELIAAPNHINQVSPIPHDGDVVVTKFGGSVLRSPDDVPRIVSEIYSHVRKGRKVVAVVSALFGETDELLAHSRQLCCPMEVRHVPSYVALGEQRAAALLAMACDRVGLDVALLDIRQLGLAAEGHALEAHPVGLDATNLLSQLERNDVVVVPGFAGVGCSGEIKLLGRGGTDLTAVFLASKLGLKSVRLIKDVDGVYDADPNVELNALVFDRISWSKACEVAVPLVQRQAIELASAARVEIEVAALGRSRMSVIGNAETAPSRSRPEQKLRVAIAGCGTIGGGILQRLLAEPSRWDVVQVLVRDVAKERSPRPADALLTFDTAQVFEANPDVIIDCLSDGSLGCAITEQALSSGISVVSANKQGIAPSLSRLSALARSSGAFLAYSSAVGGGAPMIEAIRRARSGQQIIGFEAVLNGTANFVLEELRDGRSLEEAIQAARAAGFAEEDPSADLDGLDALAKLRILALEAFGCEPEGEIVRARLAAVPAAKYGSTLRQLARCFYSNGRATASVRIEEVAAVSPFHDLRRERNALLLHFKDGGTQAVRGRGAGRWPTTEAIYADLLDLRSRAEV